MNTALRHKYTKMHKKNNCLPNVGSFCSDASLTAQFTNTVSTDQTMRIHCTSQSMDEMNTEDLYQVSSSS